MINYLPRCYPIAQQMPRHQQNRPKKIKSNFLRILNESQIELKKLILQYFKKNISTTRHTKRNYGKKTIDFNHNLIPNPLFIGFDFDYLARNQ